MDTFKLCIYKVSKKKTIASYQELAFRVPFFFSRLAGSFRSTIIGTIPITSPHPCGSNLTTGVFKLNNLYCLYFGSIILCETNELT